jgi:hypothetical protein
MYFDLSIHKLLKYKEILNSILKLKIINSNEPLSGYNTWEKLIINTRSIWTFKSFWSDIRFDYHDYRNLTKTRIKLQFPSISQFRDLMDASMLISALNVYNVPFSIVHKMCQTLKMYLRSVVNFWEIPGIYCRFLFCFN